MLVPVERMLCAFKRTKSDESTKTGVYELLFLLDVCGETNKVEIGRVVFIYEESLPNELMHEMFEELWVSSQDEYLSHLAKELPSDVVKSIIVIERIGEDISFLHHCDTLCMNEERVVVSYWAERFDSPPTRLEQITYEAEWRLACLHNVYSCLHHIQVDDNDIPIVQRRVYAYFSRNRVGSILIMGPQGLFDERSKDARRDHMTGEKGTIVSFSIGPKSRRTVVRKRSK